MKAPLILLINPWATDFAAFDLWAKPVGLLTLASLLRDGGCGVALIDCLDRRDGFTNSHPDVLKGQDKKYGTGKYPRMRLPLPAAYEGFGRYYYRHGIHPESFRAKLRDVGKPDLIWVTSAMTYWYPGVREAIQIAREELPGVPVWLGGTYARLCTGHAEAVCGADRVVTGGADELPGMISGATGFRVRNEDAWKDFRLWPPPALDLMPEVGYAPILTSIGCPYSCPYCASGVLQPRMARLSAESVTRRLDLFYYEFGIRDFAFHDDALLIGADDTLRPALEKVAAEGRPVRFHAPNALHVRSLTKEWCQLLKAAGFKTIRLGLETTSESLNRRWGGKVDTAMYLNAVENLFAAGFKGEEVGVYLLAGLPGQTPEEVAEAIEVVKRSGARPHIAEYSPIPHTAMWDEAVAISSFDLKSEPLYHNNTFFALRREDFTCRNMLGLKKLAAARSPSSIE